MSEFDFVDHYEDQEESANLLPENEAESAINCAFVGVGGFLLGYDVGIISGVLAMESFQSVFTFDDFFDGVL